MVTLPDIKPRTPVSSFSHSIPSVDGKFEVEFVSALVGMAPRFVAQVLESRKKELSLADVAILLEQDAYAETFVPRSKIIDYLAGLERPASNGRQINNVEECSIIVGDALTLINDLNDHCIDCVVTSPPYWGTRIYKNPKVVRWADGEECVFGHEQTPEGYLRHTAELLYRLKNKMKKDGSVWWNVMDTYNTRTQIRSSASEALSAMKGLDSRKWSDHACRRYSAGHSYLEDGEQCLLPSRIAERASRIGYYVKSTITWKKNGSMPETVSSRVTRELENVLHLSLSRTPKFNKKSFNKLPVKFGGRNPEYEAEKITDVWFFSTTDGANGHGAQFPLALPGRCIALSTNEGDLVLDPFMGSGTTAIVSHFLSRRALGFDISEEYAEIAMKRIRDATKQRQLI